MSSTPHEDLPVPPANRPLLWFAGLLVLIPLVALVPVGWYSRRDPELGGFPFFVWYQLLWVFLTASCTGVAYLVVQRARPHWSATAPPEADERGRS